jgi:ABC-type bacteriocin/lantibiotic exporter with double-glycine peptidase domain
MTAETLSDLAKEPSAPSPPPPDTPAPPLGDDAPEQPPREVLPRGLFRYVLENGPLMQFLVVLLTVASFLIELVPLELQRRIVNDLVKDRAFRMVIMLCGVYAAIVFVQGGLKAVLNVFRAWIGERATRDLRWRIRNAMEATSDAPVAAEANAIEVSMIVAEVEPIGGFVGEAISEPLLQGGILVTVIAYMYHLEPWMAAAALAIFSPQLILVPLMQGAINRRAGARVRVLREVSVSVVAPGDQTGRQPADEERIERAFELNMGIFRLKFTMNFLMNFSSQLQVIAALLLGGWYVFTDRLAIGGVVAFISAVGRLSDPWGDLVNYFRDVSVTQVKYRLVADMLNDGATATSADRPS